LKQAVSGVLGFSLMLMGKFGFWLWETFGRRKEARESGKAKRET
jgi:hypothetical protein